MIGAHNMRLGGLDIIGDPEVDHVRLTIGRADNPLADYVGRFDSYQIERLITYLKGLRDGMGWNKKAAADRSL